MTIKNWAKLVISIFIAEAAGLIGAMFTASNVSGWYTTITKPVLNPPAWVFGPVWITLYALMGIAAYLVWSSYAKATEGQAKLGAKRALYFYGLQLALNAIWSPIFFGLHNIGLAFAVIFLLWVFIILTIWSFAKISHAAGWLLAPYIVWVTFAMYLNSAIWILNM